MREPLIELIYDAAMDSRQAIELLEAMFAMREKDMDVEEMMPHIRRVERLFGLLEEGETHARHLLEQLPLAVVVADADGRILDTNRMAQDILGREQRIRSQDGRLCMDNSADTRRLRRAIGEVARGRLEQPQVLSFPHVGGGLKLMVHRGFVAGVFAGELRRAVVCISFSGGSGEAQERHLRERWGLTPTEARVAVQFVQHPDIAGLASRLNRSEHTVRSQIKAVFQKTGTRSQAELIRLLLDQAQEVSSAAGGEGMAFCRMPGGRKLAYSCHGPKGGKPVFYLHSFTGCHTECAIFADAIERIGIRLIAPDRPGFGRSPPAPDMTFRDWPEYVMQLADELEIQRFHVLAMSGSSAYALACALAMPERICGMALVSPMGEVCTIDDVRDMMPLNRRVLEIMLLSPLWLCRFIAHLMARAFSTDFSAYLERILPHVAESDRHLLNKASTRILIEQQFIESRRYCRSAFGEDMIRYSRPWNLELERVPVPVAIWHGEDNRHIPIAMARRLASCIPGCRTHWLPDEGYYLNFSHGEAILADLVASD